MVRVCHDSLPAARLPGHALCDEARRFTSRMPGRPHRLVQSREGSRGGQQGFPQNPPHDFALAILPSAKSWRPFREKRSWPWCARSRLCTNRLRPHGGLWMWAWFWRRAPAPCPWRAKRPKPEGRAIVQSIATGGLRVQSLPARRRPRLRCQYGQLTARYVRELRAYSELAPGLSNRDRAKVARRPRRVEVIPPAGVTTPAERAVWVPKPQVVPPAGVTTLAERASWVPKPQVVPPAGVTTLAERGGTASE